MRNQRNVLIMLFASCMIFSCKKQEPTDTPAPVGPPSPGQTVLQQLIAENILDARQSFTVNAMSGAQVMGVNGTELLFEPGAFLYMDGSQVTGQVNVKLVEVLGIGDMIWLNKQTVGNDNGTLRLLRSGGAIDVSAEQGGNSLRIAQGGLFVRIPTDVGDPAMQLFSGSDSSDGAMIWDPIDSSSVEVENAYMDLWYAFPMDSLNWINCDYFYSYPTVTMLTATIPEDQSLDNTLAWIAFPSENSVMGMNYTSPQTFTTNGAVPVGLQAVVVGLHQNSSGFHASFNPVTIESGMNVTMIFTPTTLEQFQEDVNGL